MRIGIRIGAKPVKKNFGQVVGRIIKAAEDIAEMQKARAGLVRKEVEVHRGGKTFKQNRWVRPDEVNQSKKEGKQSDGSYIPTKADKKEVLRRQKLQPYEEKYRRAEQLASWAEKQDATDAAELRQEADRYKRELEQMKNGTAENPASNKKPNKIGIRKPKGNDNQGQSKVEFKRGDKVSGVDVNGEKVSGTVTAVGADGVTIDGQFHIEHEKAKKEKSSGKYKIGDKVKRKGVGYEGQDLSVTGVIVKINDDGTYKLKKEDTGGLYNASEKELEPVENKNKPQRTYIPPEKFNASEYAKQWDDPKATADEAGKEYILKSFGAEAEEIANAIRDADSKNQHLIDNKQLTHDLYRIPPTEGESARYTPEREALHGRIMQKLLHPDKLRTALPPLGQKPTFMILGGRGGSGKSWFKNNLYDPAKTVILDADEIKSMLPEYKGWNANQVHEESSDIIEQMLTTCIRNGINVVLDNTMKTADKATAKVYRFKSAGYKVEAHYMHCPKQEAARRAIKRFKGKPEQGKENEFEPYNDRYVPVTAVLSNTTNEESFDIVRQACDVWSFRDSNGDRPVLISEGKKEMKKSFSELVRKHIQAYN
jgi:predicted kinase